MSLLSNLSGKELYWSVISGGKKLIEHQEEINKINVFPVPDGDTGSNLAATASSIIYNSKEEGSLGDIAESIGDAALDGARGNSGVIFAQFLYGLGLELKGSVNLSIKKFATIVKKASEYVYSSIPSPQEGTIITVIRVWAEFIHSHHHKFSDFGALLEKADEVAHKALLKTPEQLEVLRIAKVVDAGAKGFVLFIGGMKDAILNRTFSRDQNNVDHLLMADEESKLVDSEVLSEESLHNRFCTETCIIGDSIDKAKVLEILDQYADSIVIAGGEKKLRLHFHTNEPSIVFDKLRHFGTFLFQKVEDMRLQYNVLQHRKSPIAFVVDSGLSLSQEIMEHHQIHSIPFQISIDKQTYCDKIGISLDLFEQYFSSKKVSTKTSQPSPKAFADLFSYLAKHYESVIVLTTSSGISGTYNSALQGKDLIKSKITIPIDVVDSKNLSAGFAILAYKIAMDIESGVSHEQIIKKISKSYIPNTDNFVNLASVDHIIKSGRLGVFYGNMIKLFNLSPMLEIEEGKPIITGKSFGMRNGISKTIEKIQDQNRDKKIEGYIINHTFLDPLIQNEYLDKLKSLFGCDPISVSLAAPSIANHVGMGSVCVGILYSE